MNIKDGFQKLPLPIKNEKLLSVINRKKFAQVHKSNNKVKKYIMDDKRKTLPGMMSLAFCYNIWI